MPEAKPRDTNVPRVLLLLVNDNQIMLVPKAKPRDTNSICVILFIFCKCTQSLTNMKIVTNAKSRDTNSILYYHFSSGNVPNHLLM